MYVGEHRSITSRLDFPGFNLNFSTCDLRPVIYTVGHLSPSVKSRLHHLLIMLYVYVNREVDLNKSVNRHSSRQRNTTVNTVDKMHVITDLHFSDTKGRDGWENKRE